MKLIEEVLKQMDAISISGPQPNTLLDICYDSRKVTRNSVFVAIRGASVDGHDYIKEAVRKGATTVFAESKPDFRLPGKVTLIIVPDTRAALAKLSDYFYDSPSEMMRVVGITGTNGKTTVSYILKSILALSEKRCGTIGTVKYDLLGKECPATMTTPESLDLQRMMKTIADNQADYCLLEVSSHALSQKRVDQVSFHSAIFTNLTQDHLDYHHDIEDYFKAKALLFTKYSPRISIINSDDPYSSRLLAMIGTETLTYGIEKNSDVTAENITMDLRGIGMNVITPSGAFMVRSNMTGRHNIYNILASVCAAYADDVDFDRIAGGIARLESVPGRFETINQGQPFSVVVDYAHTHDALANVIDTARNLADGKLITVFGCGGDRDAGKRPLMGRVAWTMSDIVVVTSDNPRTESPEKIIDDILGGINQSENPAGVIKVIDDRGEAIRSAVAMAEPGDFVLIAGKGHENYQILGKKKNHFDDREEAVKAIRERYGKIQGR